MNLDSNHNSKWPEHNGAPSNWDHSTHPEFYNYYAAKSISEASRQRLSTMRDMILRLMSAQGDSTQALKVADIGCNTGTLSLIWAEQGHCVFGVDVSAEFVELAKERAKAANLDIDFQVGTATALPLPEGSMDICLAPELLEHVEDWEKCLDEFTKVLKSGGMLFLTTSNRLCPRQQEFNLPLYSWYPSRIKRHYVRLALTTRPELANYARYPAVHWFTFYKLRKALAERGFSSMDRFDIMDIESFSFPKKNIVRLIRKFPILRWLGQICTPYTVILSLRKK